MNDYEPVGVELQRLTVETHEGYIRVRKVGRVIDWDNFDGWEDMDYAGDGMDR